MSNAQQLTFEIVASHHLSTSVKTEILDLCSAAYEEDFTYYLDALASPIHLLARYSGTLVSHAAWVTRWLQAGEAKPLRTAYIKAVATAPGFQGRGYGSAVMREVVKHLGGYELAALSPSNAKFYERLGWEMWRGPLAIRAEQGLMPTPEEQVMIYRLRHTPDLDSTNLLTAEWRPVEVW